VSKYPAATIPVAGEQAILARRYIGAFYALADQEDALDEVAIDLRALRRLWTECAEWRFVAVDPRLSAEETHKAIEQVAHFSDISKLTVNFLSVLADNRRLNLLPALIEGFLDEIITRRGEYRASVRTAHPLSDEQRTALSTSLNAVAGGKVHLTVTTDPSIIGGITVKLGSQFIDASVKTKLDHLERTLKGAA
jgi:F-type H+-transporting ATPase subunit delta